MINQLSFMCETGVQRSAIGYPDSTDPFSGVLLCYNIMPDPHFNGGGQIQTRTSVRQPVSR